MKKMSFLNKTDLLKVIAVIAVLSSFFFVRHRFQPAGIIHPNGGEISKVNSPIEFSWSADMGIRAIELIPAKGGNPILVYNTEVFGYPVPDTSGSYLFNPSPGTVPAGYYYAKIYYADSTTAYDISDKPFKVATEKEFEDILSPPSPEPSITILTPNGGEKYKAGSPLKVTWKSKDISPSELLKVELISIDKTTYPEEPMVSSYAFEYSENSGKITLQTPAYLKTGTFYYVRVACSQQSIGCQDDSDAPFSVISPKKDPVKYSIPPESTASDSKLAPAASKPQIIEKKVPYDEVKKSTDEVKKPISKGFWGRLWRRIFK